MLEGSEYAYINTSNKRYYIVNATSVLTELTLPKFYYFCYLIQYDTQSLMCLIKFYTLLHKTTLFQVICL